MLELEKQINIRRRNENIAAFQKAEQEERLKQQLKNEERAQKNLEKGNIPPQKPNMARSNKPTQKKKEVVKRLITEDEADFARYVGEIDGQEVVPYQRENSTNN